MIPATTAMNRRICMIRPRSLVAPLARPMICGTAVPVWFWLLAR